jgi:hypothetical protein
MRRDTEDSLTTDAGMTDRGTDRSLRVTARLIDSHLVWDVRPGDPYRRDVDHRHVDDQVTVRHPPSARLMEVLPVAARRRRAARTIHRAENDPALVPAQEDMRHAGLNQSGMPDRARQHEDSPHSTAAALRHIADIRDHLRVK